MARPDFNTYSPTKVEISCPHCSTIFWRYPADVLNRSTVCCSRYCSSRFNTKKTSKFQTRKDIIDSFWNQVDKTPGLGPKGDCWEWRGKNIDSNGYGKLWLYHLRLRVLAHRFSYLLNKDSFHYSLCVCHTCDNPPCVNPIHLFLGTKTDNNEDKVKKDRHGFKLTSDKAREILSAKGSNTASELAAVYNISPTTVFDIWAQRTWRSIK